MKIRWSRYDVAVECLCVLLLVGTFVFLGINWNGIPDQVPAHYNASGEIDRMGSKGELLLFPAISWLVYLGVTVLERFPQAWNTGVAVTEENKDRVYRTLKNLIGTVKLAAISVFTYLTIQSVLAKPLSKWFLPAFLAVMLGSIAYCIVKLRKSKK